jgi:hypothetical protein
MTTLTDPTTPAERVFTAAKHLVEFRDGLSGALMDMAAFTADDECFTAAHRVARLCAALGADEAFRRGAVIAHLATACWGLFRTVGEEREIALSSLRGECHDTATAVRDALHRDACVCLGDDLRSRIGGAR